MANSKSALKRVRQAATRTAQNKSLTSRMKTLRRKTLEAAASGDKEVAKKYLNPNQRLILNYGPAKEKTAK